MRNSCAILFVVATLAPAQVEAWGDLGHQVTALIAYRHLTRKARSALDALLSSDGDTLTPPDFAGRTTWADKYRSANRETAAWHFINIEIDHPDPANACADDCVVKKIDEFTAELKSAATAPAERLLALKFLIHFIAEVHQPLHAADHGDRGGNCIGLASPHERAANLHGFWDVDVVEALGHSPEQIADKLDARLAAAGKAIWAQGTAMSWAMESFEVARRDASRCRLFRPAYTPVRWLCRPSIKPAPKRVPPRNCSRQPCVSRPCSMRHWDRHKIS